MSSEGNDRRNRIVLYLVFGKFTHAGRIVSNVSLFIEKNEKKHGGSVILIPFANYRSHDKLVENLEKAFEYDHHFKNTILNLAV